jgi:hypothetical protein
VGLVSSEKMLSRRVRAESNMADAMVLGDGYPRHLAIAFRRSRGPAEICLSPLLQYRSQIEGVNSFREVSALFKVQGGW